MPLKIHKRGSVWHYSGSVAGRRLRGSCRTSEKEIAQQVAANIEQREWKRHLHGPESVLTFAQAAMLYRSAGKGDRFLNAVEDYWKDTPVRQITPSGVLQACIVLYPSASAATRNRQVIGPTQAVINFAAGADLCHPLRVKRYKVERKEKEPATWEWVEAFMAHANPHLGALACFMFLTGASISEALRVQWSEVNLAKAKAIVRRTKTGVERSAHLPAALVAALANIEGREGKVFRYSSRSTAKPQWKAVIRRAKIKPLSFHACRHGFATAALQAGIDPVSVAKLGGWKSPQHVFATYGHATEDITVTDRLVTPRKGAKLTQGQSKSLKNMV